MNPAKHSTKKRFLFILTSTDRIGPKQRPTGYEFSEVAHPYLAIVAEGGSVNFASPDGGAPPEDGFDPKDMASRIFRDSLGFRSLNASARLEQVELTAYDGIFFPGGLGPMLDLRADAKVKELVAQAHESGLVVGAVCHGPVALMDVTLSDGSNYLAGRRVAAFTSAEEQGHSEQDVPFMLDVAMTEQGALHTSAPPFHQHVVVDDRLVTGQNPASAAGVALAMLQVLGSDTD